MSVRLSVCLSRTCTSERDIKTSNLSATIQRIFLHFTRTLTSKFAYWANGVTVDVMSYHPTCLLGLYFNKTELQLTWPVRRRNGWRWIAPTSSQRTSGHQTRQTSTHSTTMCGGAMLQAFQKLQSKRKTIPELKVHCSRSGMTCHRQRSTKLSTTFANVWTRAFRPMVNILSILCELDSRA